MILLPLSTITISPQQPRRISAIHVPARDRVIDFGKHKGRMLGTLPSKYLSWVSKNLRARDFEEWARLADEVLQDPVYRDRIEWESAERVLSGGEGARGRRGGKGASSVSELLEISERFGWDNDDKEGWKRIDFEMLGTSKGGKIPRRKGSKTGAAFASSQSRGLDAGNKMVGDVATGVKREERRARQRMNREQQMTKLKKEEHMVDDVDVSQNGEINKKERLTFPGRDALLRRIANKR